MCVEAKGGNTLDSQTNVHGHGVLYKKLWSIQLTRE
jgi:hypothetical protein